MVVQYVGHLRAFMSGLHSTPEPWLSECVQFKTNYRRKQRKENHKNKKTTSISRIVNVLDAYQMIIIAIFCKAI